MVNSTATPGVMASDWFSRWNRSYKAKEINRQVCVNAYLDDKVGAFSKKENADELMEKLSKAGFTSYLKYE